MEDIYMNVAMLKYRYMVVIHGSFRKAWILYYKKCNALNIMRKDITQRTTIHRKVTYEWKFCSTLTERYSKPYVLYIFEDFNFL